MDCSSIDAWGQAFGRGWQLGGKSRVAMGPSGVVAVVGVVSDSKSIPRTNRHLEWELDVDGVVDLSCWSARADFEEVVSRRVDLMIAISVGCERAVRK